MLRPTLGSPGRRGQWRRECSRFRGHRHRNPWHQTQPHPGALLANRNRSGPTYQPPRGATGSQQLRSFGHSTRTASLSRPRCPTKTDLPLPRLWWSMMKSSRCWRCSRSNSSTLSVAWLWCCAASSWSAELGWLSLARLSWSSVRPLSSSWVRQSSLSLDLLPLQDPPQFQTLRS